MEYNIGLCNYSKSFPCYSVTNLTITSYSCCLTGPSVIVSSIYFSFDTLANFLSCGQ